MKHLYLTKDHEAFRKSLRKFLAKEAEPFFEQWEEDRMIPRGFWDKLAAQGYLCPTLSEAYGGLNVDWGFAVIINEELERVGSGLVGVGLHNDIVVPYLESFGTEDQKQRWLPKCVSGEIITAIAMTEPGTGSDLANIKTTAILKDDHYVLNGSKTFITNGIHSDLVLVACKTDPKATPAYKGVSLLVVERDTPGFSRGRKLNKVGLHSQDTAELFFEDCRVPKGNLLGEEGKGFLYLMDKLQQERLLVAIAAQVAAEDMVEMTMNYIQERKAFGQSISKFQHIQFEMVEMKTQVEIGRTFLDSLVADHIAGEDIVTKVSMAKYWLTDMAKDVSQRCLQLHGGYGYMEEYKIARRFRDIPVSAIYAGTNEIMKTIIAKNMGL
ncbi:acyl-CoA dehydrogenase family protein [Pseudalkalibacillus hwajinpoensis]|uniref:acyl-CoA dehydrogenase family protein n=1 Tax=Guptibacillus hwajinpoensis TaxID=208199 RepID=UPI00325A6A03